MLYVVIINVYADGKLVGCNCVDMDTLSGDNVQEHVDNAKKHLEKEFQGQPVAATVAGLYPTNP